jgi:hypothetical protein
MKTGRPLPKNHRGSNFQDFLKEYGILKEVKARAVSALALSRTFRRTRKTGSTCAP